MTEQGRAYSRRKYFLALFHLGLELILLTLLVAGGLNFLIKEWAEAVSRQFYLQLTAYYGIFFLTLWVFDLALGFYSGFYLEHKYALSNQSFAAWLWDTVKKSLLAFSITLGLILVLYALIRNFPGHWWVGAWLGFAGFSYLLGQLFPVLIVPLFYRYSRVEDEVLKSRIFGLVKRFGLPLENVYSLNLSRTTKKANAMFAGLGRTKRLVLADTLLKNFTVDEIESVVAHELGHYKHRDIWHHLGFNFVTSFLAFALAFYGLESLVPRLGFSGAGDLAAFPLIYLMFFLFGLILTPLSNAYSRWREAEADRFALKALGPAGFIPAMEKLGRLNLADPKPHPLAVLWFYTHPAIARRIEMAKTFLLTAVWLVLLLLPTTAWAKEAEREKEPAVRAVEARNRAQILSYFLGDPKDASNVGMPLAIELYNQAVEFFEKREYDLAREAAQDSLGYDAKNPLAHELLGDIAYLEQKLDEALKCYQDAFRLKARASLREKIERVQKERAVESGLLTYEDEHFIIKYRGEAAGFEGYELKELLHESFREVGQDLGYFFRHKVVVLLYDTEEFRRLIDAPHWSGGLYDGKIRLPAYQRGFTLNEIKKIFRHEVTHAFVVELSRGKCPPWLNEGLAEYEEAKASAADLRVFKAAVRSNTLFPLASLLDREKIMEIADPLEAQLFYEESHQLVHYLVRRYGMFQIKKMLGLFAAGKDSFEAIQEILKISPLELEKQWKATLI